LNDFIEARTSGENKQANFSGAIREKVDPRQTIKVSEIQSTCPVAIENTETISKAVPKVSERLKRRSMIPLPTSTFKSGQKLVDGKVQSAKKITRRSMLPSMVPRVYNTRSSAKALQDDRMPNLNPVDSTGSNVTTDIDRPSSAKRRVRDGDDSGGEDNDENATPTQDNLSGKQMNVLDVDQVEWNCLTPTPRKKLRVRK
jgi:hypothetical protein